MRRLLPLLAACLLSAALAQQTEPEPPDPEQQRLEQSLAEAGSSPIEYARALERHLDRQPDSPRRAEIERILLQAAIDLKDRRRLLRFGPPAIDAGHRNPTALDHVTRALLDSSSKADFERALRYATLLEELMRQAAARILDDPDALPGRGRRLSEIEQALARALAFQARAHGELGRHTQAIALARQSWDLFPTAETGRELARWLERAGEPKQAVAAFAAAYVVAEETPGEHARLVFRQRLDALAAGAGVPAAELGQLLLDADNRVQRIFLARRERLQQLDPNAFAARPADFTLSALAGDPLPLTALRGKVVILDFWATWCGPCRAQYPLYRQVMKRFAGHSSVVFLAVSTDEDRGIVAPFLAQHKWDKQVYFDDGLAAHLRVNSIPTTVVLDKQGNVFSRLNGFVPDRFVDMLSDRIREALAAE